VPDPELTGPPGFPPTHISVIQRLASADPSARAGAAERIVAAYWKPVYRYLRVVRGVEHDDAQDLTQDFFAHALLRDTLAGYHPDRARFRTYLRVCLDRFAINAHKAARRLKRGGGLEAVSLDFAAAEAALSARPVRADDPEEYFRREWIRSLFESALAELRTRLEAAGKLAHYHAFVAYDIDAPAGERVTYESVGRRVGLSSTQVTNALFATRNSFRAIVLERLRELTGSHDEFVREAAVVLGVDLG
jgi:RNA polymerase sigma factor (sigma-70 family)